MAQAFNSPAENQLIKAAKKGDQEALQCLLLKYLPRITNACRAITKDDEIAYDLAQNVCVNVIQKISTFKGKSAFSTWMFRIAINESLMYRRSTMKRATREMSLTIDLDTGHDDSEEVDRALPTVDLRLEGLIDHLQIERALGMLRPKYRQVFEMRAIERLDTEQTSAKLGITIHATKSMYHRAKHMLRKQLSR